MTNDTLGFLAEKTEFLDVSWDQNMIARLSNPYPPYEAFSYS